MNNDRVPLITAWIQILAPILMVLVIGSYVYAWYIDLRAGEKIDKIVAAVAETNVKLERLLGQLEGRPTEGRRR